MSRCEGSHEQHLQLIQSQWQKPKSNESVDWATKTRNVISAHVRKYNDVGRANRKGRSLKGSAKRWADEVGVGGLVALALGVAFVMFMGIYLEKKVARSKAVLSTQTASRGKSAMNQWSPPTGLDSIKPTKLISSRTSTGTRALDSEANRISNGAIGFFRFR